MLGCISKSFETVSDVWLGCFKENSTSEQTKFALLSQNFLTISSLIFSSVKTSFSLCGLWGVTTNQI